MNLKKVLCVLVVLCAVLMFVVSTAPVRAADDTEEDETRTSAQFFPYGPYGLYGTPYVSPYALQYPSYRPLGDYIPMAGSFPMDWE